MPIRQELELEIAENRSGKYDKLLPEYGHALRAILWCGQVHAELDDSSEEVIIAKMRERAKEQVVQFGSKILDFLRPELRVLIEPEDLEALEQAHEVYFRKRENK